MPNMYLYIALITLLSISNVEYAEAQTLIIGDKTTHLKKDRYKGIKRSPFYFKKPVGASIIDRDGNKIQNIVANYNCYTGEIEIQKDKNEIALDESYVSSITFMDKEGDATFIPTPSKKLNTTYVRSHYQSDNYGLYEIKSATIAEIVFQDVGKTRTVERFSQVTNYFIKVGGEFKSIKLKKKDFFKTIHADKDIEIFVKSNKIKLKKVKEFARVLEYLDGRS